MSHDETRLEIGPTPLWKTSAGISGRAGDVTGRTSRTPAQLQRKQRRLEDLLQRDARTTGATGSSRRSACCPDASGAPWGFRNKASFVFGDAPDRRGSVIGHYAMQSRTVVPITECPVHEPARQSHRVCAARSSGARAGLRGGAITPRRAPSSDHPHHARRPRSRRHARRHPQRQVAAHADPRVSRDRGRAGRLLSEHPRSARAVHGRPRDDAAGRQEPRARDASPASSFLVSPTAFFQTNIEAAEAIVQIVLELRGSLAPACASPRPLCRQRPLRPARSPRAGIRSRRSKRTSTPCATPTPISA